MVKAKIWFTSLIVVILLQMSLFSGFAVAASKKVDNVSIDQGSKITLDVGATKKLSVTFKPNNATNKAVTWSSKNRAIASVSDTGLIQGESAGTTEITVKSKDGNKTDKIKVEVKNVSVSGVELTQGSSATIVVGEKLNLKVKVKPANATNKGMKYSSDNKSIAKVNGNGVVEGVKAGTTVIRVASNDGSKKDSITVTVNNVLETSIKFENTDYFLYDEADQFDIASTNQKLKVQFTPSNTTIKTLTWTSSNPDVASVDTSGKVTANSLGKAIITATSTTGKKTTTNVYVRDLFNEIEYIVTDNAYTTIENNNTGATADGLTAGSYGAVIVGDLDYKTDSEPNKHDSDMYKFELAQPDHLFISVCNFNLVDWSQNGEFIENNYTYSDDYEISLLKQKPDGTLQEVIANSKFSLTTEDDEWRRMETTTELSAGTYYLRLRPDTNSPYVDDFINYKMFYYVDIAIDNE